MPGRDCVPVAGRPAVACRPKQEPWLGVPLAAPGIYMPGVPGILGQGGAGSSSVLPLPGMLLTTCPSLLDSGQRADPRATPAGTGLQGPVGPSAFMSTQSAPTPITSIGNVCLLPSECLSPSRTTPVSWLRCAGKPSPNPFRERLGPSCVRKAWGGGPPGPGGGRGAHLASAPR